MLGATRASSPTRGSRVTQPVSHADGSPAPSLTAATETSAPGESLVRPAVDARSWSVLAVLCFVYVLNFLDRQLLAILAKPIQDSLHVTDGQLGLIGGLYFA